VTEEQAEKITALSLKGVTLYRVNTRFSPSGFLAPQVIGFVSFKEKDLIGRYGLERSYNEVLSRKSGRLYVNFFAEVFTQIIPKTKQEAVTEGDIITSIEPLVQGIITE
jgi:cell division protein FtsI/penicillin-binding protein 2